MRALAIALACCGSAAPAADCRLALALAIDVSSSVDANEDRLQRGGLAAALIAPEVQSAFFAVDLPVALAVYEWSGRNNQDMLVDWRIIDSPAALTEVAAAITRSERGHNEFPTAMGFALGFGATLLSHAPDCLRYTLDMAGDGENNEGFAPERAYAEFPFAGVTVNGLVVEATGEPSADSLIEFYRREVLYGPGAFLEVARGFNDYENAMRRKLEREVGERVVGELEAVHRPPG